FENARLMNEICLTRESGDFENSTTVGQVLELGDALRARWDQHFAERLVDRFTLPRRMKVGKLSRGQRAALAVTVGLASRAPLTMLDEPHLGMDAPSRYAFYEELLADYAEHPRTILLSTHHIDEVAFILEDVVIIDHGRLLMQSSVDHLRAAGVELTGPADAVDMIDSRTPDVVRAPARPHQVGGRVPTLRPRPRPPSDRCRDRRRPDPAPGPVRPPHERGGDFMSNEMMTDVARETHEPVRRPVGPPALSTTAAITTLGHLGWLGWVWLAVALLYGVAMVPISIFAELDGNSIWQDAVAGWQQWLVFAAGITTVPTFAKMMITNGVTRSQLSKSSIVAMVSLGVIGGLFITAGLAAEGLIYEANDWSRELRSGEVAPGFTTILGIGADSVLVLCAHFVAGWLCIAGFYRLGWVLGALFAVVGLVPAAFAELVLRVDAGTRIDVLDDSAPDLPAAVWMLATVALVAVASLAATWMTSEIELDN
ncbi:MAG TPA: hypothetical protein VFV63_02790, partial [Ilumatobacteraceae bacterium]|nr:hypothetical protein [Ilumatobacteraceae bacterium]